MARPQDLLLFALRPSEALGRAVAAIRGLEVAPHELRLFDDGEHKIRPLVSVRGRDVYVLCSLWGEVGDSANDRLCRLLFFVGAVRDAGAARITVVAPYLCYARKDRRTKPNDPIITRYVAAMFESVGIDRIITVEVHNVAAFENAFRCPTWHIEIAPLLAAHFAGALHGEQTVAVSPDAGGAKRAEAFRQSMEQLSRKDVGSAYMEKFRSSGVVSGELLAGDVRDKVAIIVDDLISTGGTLVRAAKACRAAGATKVFAAAAHGLFMGGAPELFATNAIDGITIVNTVPPFRLSSETAARRLTVLDASEAIARAIAACHDGS